jgi:hypothetical protein
MMRFVSLFLTISLIMIGQTSATANNHSTKKPTFLGDRLLMTAEEGVDGKFYPPRLTEIETLFPECTFKETPDGYLIGDCAIKNAAPGRARQIENIRISLTNDSVRAIAIDIDQRQLDFEGGLEIFKKLKNIELELLSCPDIEITNNASEHTLFYRVKQNGKNMGILREVTSGGSGGTGRSTSIYMGLSGPPCRWSEENDKKLAKARTGHVSQPLVIPPMTAQKHSPAPSTSCANAFDVKKCLSEQPSRINKYEHLTFMAIDHHEDKFLDQYLAIGNDCNKLMQARQRLSDEILIVTTKYRNNGSSLVTPVKSAQCGSGKDTPAGRYPKNMCAQIKDTPFSMGASSIYFSDDNLKNGVIVKKINPHFTYYTTLTRVKGIHFKSQIVAREGCNAQKDAIEDGIRYQIETKLSKDLLICG